MEFLGNNSFYALHICTDCSSCMNSELIPDSTRLLVKKGWDPSNRLREQSSPGFGEINLKISK